MSTIMSAEVDVDEEDKAMNQVMVVFIVLKNIYLFDLSILMDEHRHKNCLTTKCSLHNGM